MKRIESTYEKAARQQRTKTIISIVFLVILVLSSVGYSFVLFEENKTSSGSTNSGVVDQGNGQWVANFQGQTLFFSSSPESAKNVSVVLTKTLSTYSGNPVYVATDNQGIFNEIRSSLGLYTQRMQQACYENCSADLPIKTCNDNLIVWRESLQNRVYQNQNCVFIEGDIRAVDAFLYRIFGLS